MTKSETSFHSYTAKSVTDTAQTKLKCYKKQDFEMKRSVPQKILDMYLHYIFTTKRSKTSSRPHLGPK